MRLKNGIFEHVINYLIQTGRIKDQKELSEVTGITETTISRILHDKVKEPSKDTLRRLNAAFDYIFNMDYLNGKSTIMLVEDLMEIKHEQSSMAAEEPAGYSTKPLPLWADTLISIMSKQIKENEALNTELRQTISEVCTLRNDLQTLISTLKSQS